MHCRLDQPLNSKDCDVLGGGSAKATNHHMTDHILLEDTAYLSCQLFPCVNNPQFK